MRKKLLLALLAPLAAVVISINPAFAQPQSFTALKPGQTVVYEQTILINIVLIGYDKRDNGRRDIAVDKGTLLKQLPKEYKPVVRVPRFYGVSGRDMGLRYSFKYNVVETNNQFEDQFFGWLGRQGQVDAPTYFQQCYSGTAPPVESQPDPCNQTKNVRRITRTRSIDAPSVERWLTDNTKDMLQPGSNRAYTVYFINWYSRRDFQDHVYTKTDVVDPDTGYNFGVERPSRRMIAWGGQFSRSWFYDLSAGPVSWASNYIVDVKDLGDDKIEDYRMPPIWEYARKGYRDPSKISRDLGKVTRFVAINLLFTSSPLYDPLVTSPDVGGKKVVHIEMLQADPRVDGRRFVKPSFVRRQLSAFEPYYDWQVELEQTRPIDPGAQRALEIFAGKIRPTGRDCASQPPFNAGDYFGMLFCYFNENISEYIPAYGRKDYVAEVFAFNTTNEIGEGIGFLGYADDNWINGRQTYVFEFDAPSFRERGYGFTTTTIHEVGHHIGLSHPHDGYDSEQDIDYFPENEFYFAWDGDQSDTIMSYLDLSDGFSQFDRDNMYRWETAGYLNESNLLLADILASGKSGRVRALLERADQHAAKAQQLFNKWEYLSAARRAHLAYLTLLRAANQVGIPIERADALRVPASDAALLFKKQPRPWLNN